MAIVISGVNNNDKITASDGTIDLLSGVNFSSEIEAPSFKVGSDIQFGAAGIATAANFKTGVSNLHNLGLTLSGGQLDVGNNIKLGHAGIVTATTFVGNVTGNVNNTGALLLQVGGSEKVRITSTGEIKVNTGSGTQGLHFQASSGANANLRGVGTNYGNLGFFIGNSEILRMTSGGNVRHTGGGNDRRYTFSSDDSAHYISFDNTLNGIKLNGYGGITFETNGTNERLRIDSSGDIGLGESNPNRSGYSSPVTSIGYNSSNGYGVLELLGNQTSDNTIANIVAYNVGGSSRLAAIAFERSGANNSGAIRFETYASGSAAERLRIPSSGSIELPVDGVGIKFPNTQTPTSADTSRVGISSEMRYYETGTTTPNITSTVLNSLQIPAFTDNSFVRRVCRYVRVGHLVFCNVEIKMASTVTYYQSGISDATAPPCITGCFPFRYSYHPEVHPEINPVSIFYTGSTLTNDTLYANARKDFPGPPFIQIHKPTTNGVGTFNSTNMGEIFAPNNHIVCSFCYPIDASNADY